MAKKARKRLAAKARKPARGATKKTASRKRAVAKPRRKAAPAKAAKPVVKKPAAGKPVPSKPAATNTPAATQPAPTQQAAQPRRNFVQRIEHKVEDAVEAVFDTLTDAERLHRKLEPGIEPDQE